MHIPRIYQNLGDFLRPNKVVIIYGPRQVGKTTLLNHFLQATSLKYRLDSGEDIRIQEVLGSQDFSHIKEYAEGYDLIAIDEAQKVRNIGQGLKILVDHLPGLQIIATGSSSFELASQVGEPLTGRKITLTLFPVAQLELSKLYNAFELKENLERYLVYGAYPEVLTAEGVEEKRRILSEIAGSYLLKDILEMDRVKNSKTILDLLRLLAFQVGNEVSLSELAAQIGRDYKTVARYLDLLEKAFVIFCLRGFSRNLRKEIYKKSKYYFYDTGIRNAVISNFNPLELRDDTGCLWENFLFMERLKKQAYLNIYSNNYFWRTWDQQEIDLVEEREGKLFGYEFKWGGRSRRPPKEWLKTYPNATFDTITRDNYLPFIMGSGLGN
jgi:predicted AAA+ superfamily ATPase